MMVAAQWVSVDITTSEHARLLFGLLSPVMMWLTERLEWAEIKQLKVAFVWLDVIRYRCHGDTTQCLAHAAQWLIVEQCQTPTLPCC